MKKWMLFLMAVLFVATQATAQQTPQQHVTPQPGEIAQIVAFDNAGLLGDHIHIFGNTTDLGKWNNSISSMVILSGHWEFLVVSLNSRDGPHPNLGIDTRFPATDRGTLPRRGRTAIRWWSRHDRSCLPPSLGSQVATCAANRTLV
jgi:hypothetical protein